MSIREVNGDTVTTYEPDRVETHQEEYSRLREEYIQEHKGEYSSASRAQERLEGNASTYAYKKQNPYCHTWNKSHLL